MYVEGGKETTAQAAVPVGECRRLQVQTHLTEPRPECIASTTL